MSIFFGLVFCFEVFVGVGGFVFFFFFLVSLDGYKQIMGTFYANFLNCKEPKAVLFL